MIGYDCWGKCTRMHERGKEKKGITKVSRTCLLTQNLLAPCCSHKSIGKIAERKKPIRKPKIYLVCCISLGNALSFFKPEILEEGQNQTNSLIILKNENLRKL